MKLTLNIIIKEVASNHFDAECAQVGICVTGAQTREAAIEHVVMNIQSAFLDMRKNKLDEAGNGAIDALDIVNIPIAIDFSNMQMVHTDTPEEIVKKLGFVSSAGEMGVEAFAETLDRPCDKNYVLSLANKELLEESMKLARNLRRITKIGEPTPTEEVANQ